MPIWSLTQERFERLRKHIGDRESDHRELTQTTTKEIWIRDLDDFLEEWRFQLEDDQKRAKKISSMGRRTSTKLKIAGKAGSKKRKQGHDDDSDFEASKPKKAAVGLKKPSDMFNWLTKKDTSLGRETEPVSKAHLSMDGVMEGNSSVRTSKAASKKAPIVTHKQKGPAKHEKKMARDDDDDDEDVFTAIAKEAKQSANSKPLASTGGQGRARKPVKYALPSDHSGEEDDDDLFGDMTNSIKRLPAAKPTSMPSKSTNTALSSHSADDVNAKTAQAKKDIVTLEADDERDPSKPEVHIGSDVEATTASRHAVVRTKISSAMAERADPMTKKSKATSVKPPSPAAKAYAAKLTKSSQPPTNEITKSQTAPKKAGKKVKRSNLSDDDATDADDIANDLLDDDEDDEEPVVHAARPLRRAATTKGRYIVDNESEAEMSDESGDVYDNGISD